MIPLDVDKLQPRSSRERVYKSFDQEREYQEKMWGDSLSGGQPGNGYRSVDEFALYIQRYSNILTEVASTAMNDDAKLDVIRKIGALCTAATEWHGVVPRDVKEFVDSYGTSDLNVNPNSTT